MSALNVTTMLICEECELAQLVGVSMSGRTSHNTLQRWTTPPRCRSTHQRETFERLWLAMRWIADVDGSSGHIINEMPTAQNDEESVKVRGLKLIDHTLCASFTRQCVFGHLISLIDVPAHTDRYVAPL